MPLKLNPNSSFEYVLKSDQDKKKKPTFYIKVLTASELEKFQSIEGKMEACQNDAERLPLLEEMLADNVTGWTNMGGHEYGKTKFVDLLTVPEIEEMIEAITSFGQLDDDDLKN